MGFAGSPSFSRGGVQDIGTVAGGIDGPIANDAGAGGGED